MSSEHGFALDTQVSIVLFFHKRLLVEKDVEVVCSAEIIHHLFLIPDAIVVSAYFSAIMEGDARGAWENHKIDGRKVKSRDFCAV